MASTSRALHWTPRVLTVVFALFLTLFALDAFQQGRPLWQNLAAFGIHLIPVFLVLLVLWLATRWPWVGGVVFLALGFAYMARAGLRFGPWAVIAISGPLFLIGILFLIEARLARR